MNDAPWVLYGAPGSGSDAVVMALRACGLRHRLVLAATWEPGEGLDALRRINPLGQVPTLQLPDGTVLSESAAILIHLGLQFPAAGLLPADPGRRAQTLRGLVFIAANCYPTVSISDYPERWTTATSVSAQAKVRAAARAQLHRAWDIFAEQFSALLDEEPPGALAMLAVVVSRWSGTRAHLKRTRPAMHQALTALAEHPRLQLP
ncbi:glutathione S-transferase family protein [Ideonella alba]|uniref:Glutathione S-transferase n=1 Tax=Ideonella alba TaxID=2824118 RepID=A0A941BFJ6_9BURK|nr:glutathione S-transferase [Ideonella alba]MBQ0932146.1 glutathione S-transferase [Ideonella alba]